MPEETPNAVLVEQVKGLTKLTDERLLNLKEVLNEIKLLMQGFATKAELEEIKNDFNSTIKEIRDGFANHSKDDIDSFGSLSKKMDFLSKVIFIGMGGTSVIAFFLPFLINYFIK